MTTKDDKQTLDMLLTVGAVVGLAIGNWWIFGLIAALAVLKWMAR